MRILVIRLSAIGDIVMASGLIPALKRRWPEAQISWLAEPVGASLLQANPRLHEVIVWPRDEWRQLRAAGRYGALAASLRRFTRSLRSRDFDLVLDIQGLLKSGVWGWVSQAPRRIGLGSREGSGRLMTEVVDRPRADPRIGSEYRRLMEYLGVSADRFPMDIALTEADDRAARNALGGQGVAGDYAVLCPFTTRPQKHWFDARWQALAAALSERLGLTPVILGGPGDRPHASDLAAGIPSPCADLAGQLALRETAAVIQGARALIGVDTGLTHLGTAAGIPTVALFGSTCPYRETDSRLTRVLYEPLWCSPCRRRPICHGAYSCMRLHHSPHVVETVQALLAATA
jgi:heptosyltransferase-1